MDINTDHTAAASFAAIMRGVTTRCSFTVYCANTDISSPVRSITNSQGYLKLNIPEPQHDALSAPGLDGTIVTSNQILRYRGELYRLTSAGVRQRRAYAVTEPTNTELEYLIACVVAGDSSHTLNFDQLQRTLVNH